MPVLKFNRMSNANIPVDTLENSTLTSISKLIYNGMLIISNITNPRHNKSHIIFNEPSGLKMYGFSIVHPFIIFFNIPLRRNYIFAQFNSTYDMALDLL